MAAALVLVGIMYAARTKLHGCEIDTVHV